MPHLLQRRQLECAERQLYAEFIQRHAAQTPQNQQESTDAHSSAPATSPFDASFSVSVYYSLPLSLSLSFRLHPDAISATFSDSLSLSPFRVTWLAFNLNELSRCNHLSSCTAIHDVKSILITLDEKQIICKETIQLYKH